MTRKFWLITGVHSKRWVETIKENYKRCRTDYTELVVVENGEGIGLWNGAGEFGEHVIRSEPGADKYINAGIEHAKTLCGPDDWFLKFDSDDFYGKDRVKQANDLANAGAEACGAVSIFVKNEDGSLCVLDNKALPGETLSRPNTPHGPTLGAKLSKTILFPEPPEPWGEDAHWIEAMRETGVKFSTLPVEGFAYIRHGEDTHTFPVPAGLARHLWFVEAYDIGMWDEDLVEGRKKVEKLEPIPYSSKAFVEACEHLMKVKGSKMNVHKLKKKHINSLNRQVETKKEIERRVGELQIQIAKAQNQINVLAESHADVSGEIQRIGNEISESFGASNKIGRILLEKKVFVEGVPNSASEEDVHKAVDEHFEKQKSGKSSIKKIIT